MTFKQKGKTRTVYVPMDLVEEVKSWTQNYRRWKKLIREISRHSLGLIHGHVTNRRAAKGAQALLRVVRAAFPRLNDWLNGLPDFRMQVMCLYSGAHLWWQILATFLSRS